MYSERVVEMVFAGLPAVGDDQIFVHLLLCLLEELKSQTRTKQ